jgi:F-type H+-transporting ATPase subunit gamma
MDATASLKDVVGGMKALSAASLGQYDKSALALAGYAENVVRALQALVIDAALPDMPPESKDASAVAVVLGSDQGLVGSFNKSLAAFALGYFGRTGVPADKVALVVGGRSLASKIAAKGRDVDTLVAMPGSIRALAAAAQRIIVRIGELAVGGSAVHLFYNRKSAGGFRPWHARILPVGRSFMENLRARRWPTRSVPMYAAGRAELFSGFVEQFLFTEVYGALAGSLAAEHFARMLAMQKAEGNIEERLEGIRTEYRTRRQAEITSELIDVVVGAEAAKSV